MVNNSIFENFRGGLIVSCQALENEPLYGSDHMAGMARAALMGGAVGIRANTPQDISAIRSAVPLPIIGLYKQTIPNYEVYITPTFKSAEEISRAGADIIALDATLRLRPESKNAADLIHEVHTRLNKPVLADIDCIDAALAASDAGVEAVSTTLSGYTACSPALSTPDFSLIEALARKLSIPVVAEGRFWTLDEVNHAFDLGAYAVIIGGAITRPQLITKRFVDGIKVQKEGYRK
jgi:N-acylglucosamine-6-phosphate 2-epimerase